MGGRPRGANFEKLKFRLLKKKNKYLALCLECGVELKNTAGSRLQVHRNICKTQICDQIFPAYNSQQLQSENTSGKNQTNEVIVNSNVDTESKTWVEIEVSPNGGLLQPIQSSSTSLIPSSSSETYIISGNWNTPAGLSQINFKNSTGVSQCTKQESQELQNEAEEGQKTEGNEVFGDDLFYAEDTVINTHSVQLPEASTSTQSDKGSQNIIAKIPLNKKKEPAHKKRKLSNVIPAGNTLQEIAQKANIPQSTNDEFEAFGKIVAAHLRQLPINTALECQSDILHYLVQKRLGRNATFSTVITPTPNSHFVSLPQSSPTLSNSTSYSYLKEDKADNSEFPVTVKLET